MTGLFDGSASATQIVLIAGVLVVLFIVLVVTAGMVAHTRAEDRRANPDRPRMTVGEFVRGIKF